MARTTKAPVDLTRMLDDNVFATFGDDCPNLEELPIGSEITDIRQHGRSHWTTTTRIATRDAEGRHLLKVARGDNGCMMLHGEFEATTSIDSTSPNLSPRALAVGNFALNPDIWYILLTFHDMHANPIFDDLAEKLATMHENSLSPTGKLGFHTTTCIGTLPQDNRWQESWETFFAQNMRNKFRLEDESQGEDEEVKQLREVIVRKVIPRLRRPLETGGRRMKPCLVHGDLWKGNTGMEITSGQSIMFDATCNYAHNKYDIGAWQVPNFGMTDCIELYKQRHPPLLPEGDFEDRILLYSLPYYMHDSILFPGDLKYRRQSVEVMKQLVEKFGDYSLEPDCSNANTDAGS